jgi:hypothetical protein
MLWQEIEDEIRLKAQGARQGKAFPAPCALSLARLIEAIKA